MRGPYLFVWVVLIHQLSVWEWIDSIKSISCTATQVCSIVNVDSLLSVEVLLILVVNLIHFISDIRLSFSWKLLSILLIINLAEIINFDVCKLLHFSVLLMNNATPDTTVSKSWRISTAKVLVKNHVIIPLVITIDIVLLHSFRYKALTI